MLPSLNLSTTAVESTNPVQQDKGKLTPRCYFLLILIVADFVKKVPPFEDKKDQKDLQVRSLCHCLGKFLSYLNMQIVFFKFASL